MRPRVHVFVDFDGTISLRDTTDMLLRNFAGPEWRDIETLWERGEIGSRECMRRQIELLNVSPRELDAFLETVEIDPAFPAFVEFCRKEQLPLTVISDGLDRSIASALGRYGVSVPVIANRLEWAGGNNWRLAFPYSDAACRASSGNCKCRTMAAESDYRVLIGDGRSDFCAAEEANMVFAKSKLKTYCESKALPYVPFHNFAELPELLSEWHATCESGLVLAANNNKDSIGADK